MSRRTELNRLLCDILGSKNVYFQPPESLKLKYPAIVYSLDGMDNISADNLKYRSYKRYSVTLIDKDPDTEIPDKINSLPLCSFERHFRSDNLNHYIFNLYF